MYGQGQLLNRRPNMKMINNMYGGRDMNDDDYDDPGVSSFTKSKVDDDDDKFKNRQDKEDDIFDFFPKKNPNKTPNRDNDDKKATPFSTPQTQRESQQVDPKRTPDKTNETPVNDSTKPVQTYESPPKSVEPQTQPKQPEPQKNPITTPQAPITTKQVTDKQEPKRTITPQTQRQQSIPTQTPGRGEQSKPPIQIFPNTPFGKQEDQKSEFPQTPQPKREETQKWEQTKPEPPPGTKTPQINQQKKQDEPKPEPPKTQPANIKTPQRREEQKPETPKPEPPKSLPSILKTPQRREEQKPGPTKPELPKTQPANIKTPQRREEQKPETPKPEPPKSQPANTKTPQRRGEQQPVKPEQVKLPVNKFPVNEPKNIKYDDSIKDKVQTLERPAFVRRGKTSTSVFHVQQTIESINGDEKIKSIDIRNPRDTKRDFIERQDPISYDSKERFQDGQFPQNPSIIYQRPKVNKELNSIKFERAEKTNQQRQLDALAVVDPNDITPGQFETWHLLSALACLSEKPETVARLLENQKLHQLGYYYVRLCVDGVWRYIVVDDLFPQINEKNMHAGSALDSRLKQLSKTAPGYKNELWVSLIEKAVSKVFGCYEDIERNNSTIKDDLFMLTGAPTYDFPVSLDRFQEVQKLLSGLHQDSLVIFSLRESVDIIPKFRENLNMSHCFGYPLLNYNTQTKEVRLRNPWGWLKTPVKSTSLLKVINDEGEFSLSLGELVKYFDIATVCNFRKNYWTTSIGVRQLPNFYSSYELTLTEQSHCFLTYSQLDRRHFRNNLRDKYDYSFARVFVFNEQDELIVSNAGTGKTVTVELNLYSGKYKIIICIDWNDFTRQNEAPHDSTFTYFGSEQAQIKRVLFQNIPNYFADAVGPSAIQLGSKKTTPSPQVTEHLWVLEDEKLIVLTWSNNSDQQLRFKKDLSRIQNRNQLIPVAFTLPNPKTTTTKDIIEKKFQGWLEQGSVEFELQPRKTKSIVLKPQQIGQNLDKAFIKQLSLQ